MIDKLKDFGVSAFTNVFDKFSSTKISDTYDAGLPDLRGPKPITITFFKDRAEFAYKEYLIFTKKIIIKPNDIIELEFGVQDANNTTNTITGAIAGGILLGGLGALALAGQSSKRRKEDRLHLIINYKGQPRPLYFQNNNKTQKLYKEFYRLFSLKLPHPTASMNSISNLNTGDMLKQLSDLNDLLKQGVLTQEEFDTHKKKILAS